MKAKEFPIEDIKEAKAIQETPIEESTKKIQELAQQENQINSQDLIGQSLICLATGVSDLEIIDTDKSTQSQKIMKTVKVLNCVMGFKISNKELPIFILQKGIDTNVINITRL